MGVGGDESEMRFKEGDESGGNGSMGCPSSGVEMTTSMALFPKPDPFFSSADWDPIVPTMVSNNGFSSFQYCSLPMEYQGMNSFAGYTSASGSSCFRMEPNQMIPRKDIEGEEAIAASFNRKRRKPDTESESNPSLNWNKKAVEEHQNDAAKDQSLKKSDFEQNPGVANSNGKQPVKEITEKENSQSGEAPKENYIHMRARKGQATNSHSLAERVRREKISERMRLLQELVPGCNKITGKAVMLDEIINYVQSLQQQVEFLSMKLATVNPEMNFDIERIMSKDISRGGNATILGFSQGISQSHHPYGVVQGTIPNMPSTNQHFTHLPQAVMDNELQGLYQMGLLPTSTMNGLAPNGRLKPEL